ncbi:MULTISPECIES: amino acid ABC transporter permease [Enterococcus]|uniref:Amino acid ABC transporter permease n=1 Tax=Enterococcus alishanensis TaxID=1303817 RepID=A0ABS6TFE2_9ENTE|nr:amino acid ABC transporter permease [Enterococcus alishanensis]MBV7391598.1 amino acid ABC transporter permease [Enterococcus alishanensis]
MNYLIDVMPQLLAGATTTVKLFLYTIVGSLPLGIILAFGLVSRFKPLQWIIQLYVWVMRGTPLLLQLILVFYGLPIIGIVFDRFPAALFAFILNYAAYYAEIFRGGIQSVPVGQYEAARVIGLTPGQTITKIVIPQVTKIVLPSVGNEVISLVKDTSLVYVLGLSDVMRAGRIAMERDTTLMPLIGVAIIYLVMTGITTLIMKQLERRMNYYR